MIESQNASLVYTDHGKQLYACRDVTMRVNPGEFVGILGPSGSGKSSLLYLLSGLKVPSSGETLYEGVSLSRTPDAVRAAIRLRDFGFVFQYPYLLGYLSAMENVLVARPDLDGHEQARSLLVNLGMESKMHRLPHELSGGERQRVCVARSLLGSPRVIFADEPTASLDHENGIQVVALLNRYRGEGALVMVTHDPSMLTAADRIVRLEDGVVAEGS